MGRVVDPWMEWDGSNELYRLGCTPDRRAPGGHPNPSPLLGRHSNGEGLATPAMPVADIAERRSMIYESHAPVFLSWRSYCPGLYDQMDPNGAYRFLDSS